MYVCSFGLPLSPFYYLQLAFGLGWRTARSDRGLWLCMHNASNQPNQESSSFLEYLCFPPPLPFSALSMYSLYQRRVAAGIWNGIGDRIRSRPRGGYRLPSSKPPISLFVLCLLQRGQMIGPFQSFELQTKRVLDTDLGTNALHSVEKEEEEETSSAEESITISLCTCIRKGGDSSLSLSLASGHVDAYVASICNHLYVHTGHIKFCLSHLETPHKCLSSPPTNLPRVSRKAEGPSASVVVPFNARGRKAVCSAHTKKPAATTQHIQRERLVQSFPSAAERPCCCCSVCVWVSGVASHGPGRSVKEK